MMSESESELDNGIGGGGGAEPELLCPTCASKDFAAEANGMRCQKCRGMLAGGPRARAAIAKSVAQGALDAPQGALSCARCADLLVPVDFEEHRFHACASCRLVWSPKGAAPSLPPERRSRTLRFGDDRVELRQDGSAVVTSAKEMPDWEPKKRHVPRVHIEDSAFQVTRAIAQEGGRYRYELMPFDATRTMLIGPAIQYDAWFVDARDGVVADLPSPVRTAKRVLLGVVVVAPLIVGVLYYKPYESWFEEAPPTVSREKAMKPLRVDPPKPKVVTAPDLSTTPTNRGPVRTEPVAVPPVQRPPGARVTSPVRVVREGRPLPPPKPKLAPVASDITFRVGATGTLQASFRIGGRRQRVKVSGSGGNFIPLALAESIAPGMRSGRPLAVEVEFPGGKPQKINFIVHGQEVVLGPDFLSKYTRVATATGIEKWAHK